MAEPTVPQIRAMVVGTSAVVAERVKTALRRAPAVVLLAEAVDGVDAVSKLRRQDLDVIFIDIGDAAVKAQTDLTRLLKVDAHAQIVLVATLTFANVKNAMAGLVNGAAEFIHVPSAHTPNVTEADFAREVADLARALGRARREKGTRVIEKLAPRHDHPLPATLRTRRKFVPAAIAIASSTGGPQALFTLFADLPKTVSQPIFVTQHMPAGFTTALASHIVSRTGWACVEGSSGARVTGRQVYLAPGDHHMVVARHPAGTIVKINQEPQENFCRPSAEPMLRSLVDVYGGANLLVVVLTGMGADGRAGAKLVADAGGTVIAQDKETSVVWGMPGAVAAAGLCSAILPLGEIGPFLAKAARGE